MGSFDDEGERSNQPSFPSEPHDCELTSPESTAGDDCSRWRLASAGASLNVMAWRAGEGDLVMGVLFCLIAGFCGEVSGDPCAVLLTGVCGDTDRSSAGDGDPT